MGPEDGVFNGDWFCWWILFMLPENEGEGRGRSEFFKWRTHRDCEADNRGPKSQHLNILGAKTVIKPYIYNNKDFFKKLWTKFPYDY